MEKNGKLKLLALLVLIMMIVVLPITAFAEGEGDGGNGQTDDKIRLTIRVRIPVGTDETLENRIRNGQYSFSFSIEKVQQTGNEDTPTPYKLEVTGPFYDDDDDGRWEASNWIDLTAGEYYVTEEKVSIEGYSLDTHYLSGSTNLGDPSNPERAIINMETVTEMTVENEYQPEYGNLIITKIFAGAPFEKASDFIFLSFEPN